MTRKLSRSSEVRNLEKSPNTTPLNPEKIERLSSEVRSFLESRKEILKSWHDDDSNATYMKYKAMLNLEFLGMSFLDDISGGKKIIAPPALNGKAKFILKEIDKCPHAYKAVSETIAKLVESETPLVEELKGIAVGIINGTITRPKLNHRDASKNLWRDFYIQLAIYQLTEHGLPAIHQNDYDGISAVSIVKNELNDMNICLSESALNTIWKHRPK